jgi:catechol 2,3-dioxygenase-like lactoylglutathione lyase family enzyme
VSVARDDAGVACHALSERFQAVSECADAFTDASDALTNVTDALTVPPTRHADRGDASIELRDGRPLSRDAPSDGTAARSDGCPSPGVRPDALAVWENPGDNCSDVDGAAPTRWPPRRRVARGSAGRPGDIQIVRYMKEVELPAKLGDGPAMTTLVAAEPQLYVRDIVASCEFYSRMLGFTIAFTYGDPAFYGQVSRDRARLNLRQVDQPVVDPVRRDAEQLLAGSIALEDATPLFLEYEKAGVEFVQPLRTEPWGAETFIVRDPDGNLLLFAGRAR